MEILSNSESKVEDIIDWLLVRSSVLAILEIFYPFGNGSALVLRLSITVIGEISSPRRALLIPKVIGEDTKLSGTTCLVRGVALGFKSPGGSTTTISENSSADRWHRLCCYLSYSLLHYLDFVL